jgi:hypothetical protein
MKTKYIRITKITLAMMILLVVQFSSIVAQTSLEIAKNLKFVGEVIFDQCVSGNCVNGRGKMVYTNGVIYEGDFVNGKIEGQGTLTFPSGEIYVGQFSNNARNGRGKNTYSNGDIYDGNWVNEKKEGQGVFTSKDGSYYSGEWKNDKSNGFGKDFIKATNITREGTYKDGLFVNSNTGISIITQFAPKTGTMSGCKFILSEGCRNYIMQSTTAEILPQVKDSRIWARGEFVSTAFNATFVEGTGGILSVEFGEFGKTDSNSLKPAENLKWGENVKSVKKKYGEPLQITVDKDKIFHSYKNFQLVYFRDNKLRWITFARNKTESEIVAEKVVEETRNRERLEAERIANTPEGKAAKIQKFYLANKELDSELDKYTADINKLIRRSNVIADKYGETSETYTMKREVHSLCFKAINLIDDFLIVYADQVSPKATANLLESRKNYVATMSNAGKEITKRL